MIPQSNISKLSNRLFKEQGGQRIPESVLERDYCIAWFLIGLSKSTLKDTLIFKGGTALRRCHFPEYRFSEDLDFTLSKHIDLEHLMEELFFIYETVKAASNIDIGFSRHDSKAHKNCYTFYLKYQGPLPAVTSTKEIKVDITINEKIYYPFEELSVFTTYPEFSDLPKNERICVYSLSEIAVEKTMALLDKARTEPRDLYDLWFITELDRSVILNECREALKEKLNHRNRSLDDTLGEFQRKEARLRRTWHSRLSYQMSNLPEFEQIFRDVRRALRQANII